MKKFEKFENLLIIFFKKVLGRREVVVVGVYLIENHPWLE
jgi:hypothetical protein